MISDFGCLIGKLPIAGLMDIRPIINLGRLLVVGLLIIIVSISRTSMLRDNPLSGILG